MVPRWHQRLESYSAALRQLEAGAALARTRPLNDLERQGLIQVFEFSFELAWNLLKDQFRYQGMPEMLGSRDVFRTANANGLLEDGALWMEMIRSRNRTSHTYHRPTAEAIGQRILEAYVSAFLELEARLIRRREGADGAPIP
jgi:nucleotidyltransferase substrate binding protein (TIGR01987 family)